LGAGESASLAEFLNRKRRQRLKARRGDVAEVLGRVLRFARATIRGEYRFEVEKAQLFAGCQHVEGRHYDRWRSITKSTLELAMGSSDQSLSITELAHQAGVPERTFRTAFHRSYGISPQDYLRIQRLYEAQHLLRESGQDRTTVTKIAFGLGFWDLGRFAGRYHTLFGEHPSETLRNHVINRRANTKPQRASGGVTE